MCISHKISRKNYWHIDYEKILENKRDSEYVYWSLKINLNILYWIFTTGIPLHWFVMIIFIKA